MGIKEYKALLKLFTLLLVLPLRALCQDNVALRTYIYDLLNRKKETYLLNNFDSINRYNIEDMRNSFQYLSKYDTDSVIYNNLDVYVKILYVYLSQEDKEIRHKALHLFLNTYRLCGGTSNILSIKPDDVDDTIKTKILDILSNKPYSEKELKVLTTKEEQYFNKVYSDEYLLEYRRIDTTIMNLSYARDSLINRSMEEFSETLKTPTYKIDPLAELCAWLYIKEAIPYIKNKVQTNEVCNEKLKCYLTRLGNSDYEDELIEANYQAKVFDYHELAFINTKKSLKAMIDGLRVHGQDHGVISGFNKRGRYKAIEVVGDYYKLTNLKLLLYGNYFKEELPYSYIPNDLSLCEEVAKWMEENIDKLEVNPNLRF